MSEACPNVGQFLQNLEFTLAMENEITPPPPPLGRDPERRRRPARCGDRVADGQPGRRDGLAGRV